MDLQEFLKLEGTSIKDFADDIAPPEPVKFEGATDSLMQAIDMGVQLDFSDIEALGPFIDAFRQKHGEGAEFKDSASIFEQFGYQPLNVTRWKPEAFKNWASSTPIPWDNEERPYRNDEDDHYEQSQANELAMGVPDLSYFMRVEKAAEQYDATEEDTPERSKALAELQAALTQHKMHQDDILAAQKDMLVNEKTITDVVAERRHQWEKTQGEGANASNLIRETVFDPFLEGLASAGEDIVDIFNYAVEGDKDAFARRAFRRAVDATTKDSRLDEYGLLSSGMGVTADLSRLSGYMAPSMVAGLATGGAASLSQAGAGVARAAAGKAASTAARRAAYGTLAAQAFSGGFGEAKNAGWSDLGAIGNGVARSAIEIASEMLGLKVFGKSAQWLAGSKLGQKLHLPPGLGSKLGDFTVEEFLAQRFDPLRRSGYSTVGQGALNAVGLAINEGSEETFAGVMGAIYDHMSGMDPIDNSSPVAFFNSIFEKIQDIAYEGMLGGSFGGAIGLLHAAGDFPRAGAIEERANRMARARYEAWLKGLQKEHVPQEEVVVDGMKVTEEDLQKILGWLTDPESEVIDGVLPDDVEGYMEAIIAADKEAASAWKVAEFMGVTKDLFVNYHKYFRPTTPEQWNALLQVSVAEAKYMQATELKQITDILENQEQVEEEIDGIPEGISEPGEGWELEQDLKVIRETNAFEDIEKSFTNKQAAYVAERIRNGQDLTEDQIRGFKQEYEDDLRQRARDSGFKLKALEKMSLTQLEDAEGLTPEQYQDKRARRALAKGRPGMETFVTEAGWSPREIAKLNDDQLAFVIGKLAEGPYSVRQFVKDGKQGAPVNTSTVTEGWTVEAPPPEIPGLATVDSALGKLDEGMGTVQQAMAKLLDELGDSAYEAFGSPQELADYIAEKTGLALDPELGLPVTIASGVATARQTLGGLTDNQAERALERPIRKLRKKPWQTADGLATKTFGADRVEEAMNALAEAGAIQRGYDENGVAVYALPFEAMPEGVTRTEPVTPEKLRTSQVLPVINKMFPGMSDMTRERLVEEILGFEEGRAMRGLDAPSLGYYAMPSSWSETINGEPTLRQSFDPDLNRNRNKLEALRKKRSKKKPAGHYATSSGISRALRVVDAKYNSNRILEEIVFWETDVTPAEALSVVMGALGYEPSAIHAITPVAPSNTDPDRAGSIYKVSAVAAPASHARLTDFITAPDGARTSLQDYANSLDFTPIEQELYDRLKAVLERQPGGAPAVIFRRSSDDWGIYSSGQRTITITAYGLTDTDPNARPERTLLHEMVHAAVEGQLVRSWAPDKYKKHYSQVPGHERLLKFVDDLYKVLYTNAMQEMMAATNVATVTSHKALYHQHPILKGTHAPYGFKNAKELLTIAMTEPAMQSYLAGLDIAKIRSLLPEASQKVLDEFTHKDSKSVLQVLWDMIAELLGMKGKGPMMHEVVGNVTMKIAELEADHRDKITWYSESNGFWQGDYNGPANSDASMSLKKAKQIGKDTATKLWGWLEGAHPQEKATITDIRKLGGFGVQRELSRSQARSRLVSDLIKKLAKSGQYPKLQLDSKGRISHATAQLLNRAFTHPNSPIWKHIPDELAIEMRKLRGDIQRVGQKIQDHLPDKSQLSLTITQNADVYVTRTYAKFSEPAGWKHRVFNSGQISQEYFRRLLQDRLMRVFSPEGRWKTDQDGNTVYERPVVKLPKTIDQAGNAVDWEEFAAEDLLAMDTDRRNSLIRRYVTRPLSFLTDQYGNIKDLTGFVPTNPEEYIASQTWTLANYLLNRGTVALDAGDPANTKVDPVHYNALRRRKDIAKAVRELYGENTGLIENYVQSVMAASEAYAMLKMQDDIIAQLEGKLIFREMTNQAGSSITKIDPNKEIPQLSRLADFYTDEDTARYIRNAFQSQGAGGIAQRFWVSLMGTSKAMKTVGAFPRADIRNFLGNGYIYIANGGRMQDVVDIIFRSGNFPGPRTILSSLTSKYQLEGDVTGYTYPLAFGAQTDALAEELAWYRGLGLGEDATVADLQDAMANIGSMTARWVMEWDEADAEAKSKAQKWLKKVTEVARDTAQRRSALYQAEDVVWKIMTYHMFLRKLQLAPEYKGLTPTDYLANPDAEPNAMEREAAAMVRKLTPTYADAWEAVRLWSRYAPLGPFAIFTGEIFRNSFERNKFALEYYLKRSPYGRALGGQYDPNAKNDPRYHIGQHMFWGQFTVLAMAWMFREASMLMLGISDEEDVAYRQRTPIWFRNGQLMYLAGDRGNRWVFDLSYNDPFSVFQQSFKAPQHEDTPGLAHEALQAFMGEDIAVGAIIDVLRNRTEDGRPVWHEGLGDAERNLAIVQHLGKSLTPGAAEILYKMIYKRGIQERDMLGVLNEAIAGLGGFRVYNIDQNNDFFTVNNLHAQMGKSNAAVRQWFGKQTRVPLSRLEEVYRSAMDKKRETMRQMKRFMMGAEVLGQEDVLQQYMNMAGGGQVKEIEYAYLNRFLPYLPGEDELRSYLSLPDGEARYDLLHRLYGEYLDDDMPLVLEERL